MTAWRRARAGLAGAALVLAASASAAAQDETLNFVTVAWPPYYGPDLDDGGFTVAVARAAYERAGYGYSVEFRPWSRAMGAAKQGSFDGLHGAFYSQERDADFHISGSALYTARTVLMAWESSPLESYEQLRDLLDYRIGVYQDYAYPEPFASAQMLEKRAHPNNLMNLRQLASGRLDLVAGGETVLRQQARDDPRLDASKLKIIEPALGVQDLLMMVPKGRPDGRDLLAAFDRGMDAIRTDGTYDDILQAYGIR